LSRLLGAHRCGQYRSGPHEAGREQQEFHSVSPIGDRTTSLLRKRGRIGRGATRTNRRDPPPLRTTIKDRPGFGQPHGWSHIGRMAGWPGRSGQRVRPKRGPMAGSGVARSPEDRRIYAGFTIGLTEGRTRWLIRPTSCQRTHALAVGSAYSSRACHAVIRGAPLPLP
jgi:hypothetical protein